MGTVKFGDKLLIIWGYIIYNDIKYIYKINKDLDLKLYIKILNNNLVFLISNSYYIYYGPGLYIKKTSSFNIRRIY